MAILLLGLLYPIILLFTIGALIKNWRMSIRNGFRNDDELSGWIIFWGIVFTSLAPLIGFIRFDDFGSNIPFSKSHVGIIELLVIVSAVCYWVSKFFKRKLSPLVNFLLRAGLIQGIILDAIVTIHFTNYMPSGMLFPLFGFELLAPPIAMLFIIYELQCNSRVTQQNTALLFSTEKKFLLQAGIVIALIFVEQAMLLPAGSQWDSLVRAFTESRGFIFSNGNYSQSLLESKII
jgi:hypothetical protein